MAHTVQQEILLITQSSLSKWNLCENNNVETGRLFSNVDRLEQACWNGMLDDFLPGMLVKEEGKRLFIWEIQNAKNFLHIDLCEGPNFLNRGYSIDPYIFINYLNCN